MADDGETKDDVKVPDGEVGEKIDKLFTTDEKDTSKSRHQPLEGFRAYTDTSSFSQTSSFLLPWVSKLRSKPRRPPVVRFLPSTHYDIDLVPSKALPFPLARRLLESYSNVLGS